MADTARWRIMNPERSRVFMWGAADQARVNSYILRELGCELVALVDDTPGKTSPIRDVPLFYGWPELEPWLKKQDPETLGFIVPIGAPYAHARIRIHDHLIGVGSTPVSMVHPTAKICGSARIGAGLQVMPDVIVHAEAIIGRQCLLNTRCLVEHDCVLEDGVEIGPGVTLAGRVHIGANSWIGTGASVRPHVRVGRNVIVGAGAVVVSDIPDGVVAVGVPAKPLPDRTTPSAQHAGAN